MVTADHISMFSESHTSMTTGKKRINADARPKGIYSPSIYSISSIRIVTPQPIMSLTNPELVKNLNLSAPGISTSKVDKDEPWTVAHLKTVTSAR